MTIYGKRRPSWIRGTAVVGVGLTFLAGVRPALGIGNQPAGIMPRPLLPAQGAKAPDSPPFPEQDRAERVRMRIAPTNVHLVGSTPLAVVSADDPGALFDGDSATKFGSTGVARVRVSLPAPE